MVRKTGHWSMTQMKFGKNLVITGLVNLEA